MQKLIVANWKSNPKRLSAAVRLARLSDKKGAVIAPPYVYIEAISRILRHAALGAQDVFFEDGGAHTGEIGVSQLKNLGVEYVIIGHSERRALGETDAVVNKKLMRALKSGMHAILCVGEQSSVRRLGVTAAKQFVRRQLNADLTHIPKLLLKRLIVAYEPVWAIGTGEADAPEKSVEIITTIKATLLKKGIRSPKVLYGGSVTSRNAEQFLSRAEIDGALVGGASLKPSEFRKILMHR